MPGYSPSKIADTRESILLAGEKCDLANEINTQVLQASKFMSIDMLSRHETLHLPLNLSAIIYFIGFGKSSLNQTIFSTQTLLSYLNLAHLRKCKFILVIGPDSASTTKTSLLLANQFEQVSRIKMDVIQFQPNLSQSDQAELILQKIIYKHKAVLKKSVTPLTHVNQVVTPKPKENSPKNTKKIVSAIIIGGIVGIVGTLALVSHHLLINGIDKFKNSRLQEANEYFSAYEKISIFDINNYLHTSSDDLTITQALLLKKLVFVIFDEMKPNKDLALQESTGKYFGEVKNQSISILNTFKPNQSSERIQVLKKKLELLKNVSEKNLLVLPKLSPLITNGQSFNLLILVHDSKSPAPSGGKIQGIVLATISSGKITEARYHTSRTIDNFFPGQLSSSEIYASASGKSQLSLSELSYEPDTSKVMSTAANYVERSLLKKVNIVVSLSTNQLFQLFNLSQISNSQMQLSDSLINSTVEKINLMSKQEKIELLYSGLDLLETRQLRILSLDPPVPELDIVEWSGKLQQTDCNSWLPCISQLIYPSFHLLEPATLSDPLKYSVEILNQVSPTDINSRLKLHLVSSLTERARLIFWLAHSGHLKVDHLQFNGQLVLPKIKKTNYSPGVSLYGYMIEVSSSKENNLEINYSQTIPPNLERFRYQIEVLNNSSEIQGFSSGFKYPPQWQTVSHLVPTVASIGDLRYNVPLTSPKLILEFIQK